MEDENIKEKVIKYLFDGKPGKFGLFTITALAVAFFNIDINTVVLTVILLINYNILKNSYNSLN